MNQPAQNLPSIAYRVKLFLELIRFSHTIFALPFALLAACWAWVVPLPGTLELASVSPIHFSPKDALGVLLCMVTARSFAMAVNRLADAKIDADNPRTASRHLPRGLLSPSQVYLFILFCAGLFVASCVLFLPNRMPLILSVPVLLFLAGYSFAKRFSWAVHFWLGAALGLAPICTWIALRGQFVQQEFADLYPVIGLGIAILFWVAGFDMIYACQDADSDRKAGLHSLPARYGISRALQVASVCHAFMWAILLSLGWVFPILSLHWIWNAALVLIGGLLIFEHMLVSPRDLTKVNIAFFNMNAIISLALCVVGGLDAWQR